MRVAVFTSNDRTWALPTWVRTIPVLAAGHEVVGLWTFPERIGRRKGLEIPLWYLRTFGLRTFLLLGLYAVLTRLRQRRRGIATWRDLAMRHGLELHRAASPNAPEAAAWVRDREIDVLFVMVGEILQPELLAAPRIGAINKHASLLPAARGVFPFFWSRMHHLPLGVSFHTVDEGIDTGAVLVQERYPRESDPRVSLLRFYADVYARYPALAPAAVDRLASGVQAEQAPGVEPSYFGFPTRADARRYARAGFRIARLSDLWYLPTE